MAVKSLPLRKQGCDRLEYRNAGQTWVCAKTASMVITKEETFGPVAPLYRYEGEAIKMPTTPNSVSRPIFYSRDIGRVWRVAEALEYGIVGMNESIISTEIAPFGGMKEIGIGREGSKYGIQELLEGRLIAGLH